MSIEVMDVDGEKVLSSERAEATQDFHRREQPGFFCGNASDYVVLASRMSEGKLLRFFFGADLRQWRVQEFVNALGAHAVKYSAQPNMGRADGKPGSGGLNYLEDAMARRLAAGEVSFDFAVQLQSDARDMPVEDPTIR